MHHMLLYTSLEHFKTLTSQIGAIRPFDSTEFGLFGVMLLIYISKIKTHSQSYINLIMSTVQES